MNGARQFRFWPGRRQPPRFIEHGEWAERTSRPRVLIENADGAELWAHSGILRDAGYDVAVCKGPTEHVMRRSGFRRLLPLSSTHAEPADDDVEPVLCPLLVNGRCGLVEGADVVVSSTDLPQSRGILAAIARKRSPALVVEGPRNVLAEDSEAIGGSTVITLPVTEQRLLAAVAEALTAKPKD